MLSASSPDDEALVLGAKYFGFEFVNRIDGSAVIKTWDVFATPLPPLPPLPPIATATIVPPIATPSPGNKPNLSTESLTSRSPLKSTVWSTTWTVKSPKTSGTTLKGFRKRSGDDCKTEKTGAVTQVSYEVRRRDFSGVFRFEESLQIGYTEVYSPKCVKARIWKKGGDTKAIYPGFPIAYLSFTHRTDKNQFPKIFRLHHRVYTETIFCTLKSSVYKGGEIGGQASTHPILPLPAVGTRITWAP